MSQGPPGPKGPSGPDYPYPGSFIMLQGIFDVTSSTTTVSCDFQEHDMIILTTYQTGSNQYTSSMPYVSSHTYTTGFNVTSETGDDNTYSWIIFRPPTSTPGYDS